MSKGVSKVLGVSDSNCRSVFTLTFAVETLGFEVWEECEEGWLENSSCVQGLKMQCTLFPGQVYDLDVMMWPHVAKIWCGDQYGWVRTWQFLQRRWLAFSISFAFPVRVQDMQDYVATVTPTYGIASFGSNARGDRNSEVYLPHLEFGVRRYFAPVLEEEEESLLIFVQKIILQIIEKFVPWTCFDELFDVPHVVTDIRHQDKCIDSVRDLILSRVEPSETERKSDLVQAKGTDKKKVVDIPKTKLEIKLPGAHILSGTGRIVPFETLGDLQPDTPEIIVLISSNNLPAQDDLPIVFLNVENLFQIPLNELKVLRINELYIKWKIGEEEHCSEVQPLKTNSTINFKDHRALPIPFELLPKITSEFLDTCYNIELRGIRLPAEPAKEPKLFGYGKGDRDFARTVPKPINEELDFIIAVTRIDARHLAKGINALLRGEYPLYPPRVAVKPLEREGFCTNDINSIRIPVAPNLIVRPDIILQAQMSLEVSIGVVGCKTRKLTESFSRMFCLVRDTKAIMTLLRNISEINEEIILSGRKQDLISGFALDTGNVVVLFVEGPRDGHILRIWDMTEDFYPEMKPIFSCSDRFSTRIYPELIAAAAPFIVLKMFVPLNVLLACPPVYARPALPLPTRAAVLKIGGLITSECHTFPSRCKLPTSAELKSFRLELCVAPRPTPIIIMEPEHQAQRSRQSVSKINWNK